jgi:hypothetical protein
MSMLGLLAYIGIIVFFLRLMRLLHERDGDAVKRGDDFPVTHKPGKGFLAFLDQVRSEA